MKDSKDKIQEQQQLSRVRTRKNKKFEKYFVILCCAWSVCSILLILKQIATEGVMPLEVIAQDTFVNISLSMSIGGLIAYWSVKRKPHQKSDQNILMEKCMIIIVIAMAVSVSIQYLFSNAIGKLVSLISMTVANAATCVWCGAISDVLESS